MSCNRHRGTAARSAAALAIALSTSHCGLLGSSGPFVALSASQEKVRDRGEAVEFEGADVMLRLDESREEVCIDPGQRDTTPSIYCLVKDGWEHHDKPDHPEVYCCKEPLAWRIRYHAGNAPRAFQGVMYERGKKAPEDPFYFSVYVPRSGSSPAPVAQDCPPAAKAALADGAR
jgi:hypothetical protein